MKAESVYGKEICLFISVIRHCLFVNLCQIMVRRQYTKRMLDGKEIDILNCQPLEYHVKITPFG